MAENKPKLTEFERAALERFAETGSFYKRGKATRHVSQAIGRLYKKGFIDQTLPVLDWHLSELGKQELGL